MFFAVLTNSISFSIVTVRLGESVRIFGYPALSGGYSLTIIDGIVGSFPGDGLIVTSAKISAGNSGGLAVDQYGCRVGIPSMVSSDETESLGVIISNNLIYEFLDKIDVLSRLFRIETCLLIKLVFSGPSQTEKLQSYE